MSLFLLYKHYFHTHCDEIVSLTQNYSESTIYIYIYIYVHCMLRHGALYNVTFIQGSQLIPQNTAFESKSDCFKLKSFIYSS